MVWVDESSLVGKQMIVNSHGVGTLFTERTRKTHGLITEWRLSYIALFFLISTKHLKPIFSTNLEHTVCLSSSLPYFEFIDFSLFRVRRGRDKQLSQYLGDTPERAVFFCSS